MIARHTHFQFIYLPNPLQFCFLVIWSLIPFNYHHCQLSVIHRTFCLGHMPQDCSAHTDPSALPTSQGKKRIKKPMLKIRRKSCLHLGTKKTKGETKGSVSDQCSTPRVSSPPLTLEPICLSNDGCGSLFCVSALTSTPLLLVKKNLYMKTPRDLFTRKTNMEKENGGTLGHSGANRWAG